MKKEYGHSRNTGTYRGRRTAHVSLRRRDAVPEHICVNCGNGFNGTYCNECGQHFDTKRLTGRELWDNIAFSFINFEKGIPNTVIKLFSTPGKMIDDYIRGHRVTYSHPVALLIVACTVYGIVMGVVGAASSGVVATDKGWFADIFSEGGAFARITGYVIYKLRNSTIFMALLPVPVFAWMVKRLFRKYGSRDYNYAEMMFMGLYMASQRMIVSTLIDPFITFFPDVDQLSTVKYILYVVLAAWCFRGMFPVKWGKAVWKAILMFIVGWLVFGVLMLLLLMIIVLLVVLVAYLFNGDLYNDIVNNVKGVD